MAIAPLPPKFVIFLIFILNVFVKTEPELRHE